MKEIIFINGTLRGKNEAKISVMSPGLRYGWGVFETMRSRDSRIVYFKEHLARFLSSAKRLKIKVAFSAAQLRRAVRQTVEANGFKDSAIRLSVYQGKRGGDTIITARRYIPSRPQKYLAGFSACISDFVCNERSWLTRIKSANRLAYELAYQRAVASGFDEALVRNTQGYISEGTRANLFMCSSATLFTPPLSSGCLEGITRKAVLDLAKKAKIRIKEENVSLEMLYGAKEAFLTNSLMGVMPLTGVNNLPIGQGKRGKCTSFFIEKYDRLLGNERIKALCSCLKKR
jgi:branched-chain amino acid aminotransferase